MILFIIRKIILINITKISIKSRQLKGILQFPPVVKKYYILNFYIRSRKNKVKKHHIIYVKEEEKSHYILKIVYMNYIESILLYYHINMRIAEKIHGNI